MLSVIIILITKSKTSQRESALFITSLITDRIGRHEVLLPINHKNVYLCIKAAIVAETTRKTKKIYFRSTLSLASCMYACFITVTIA